MTTAPETIDLQRAAKERLGFGRTSARRYVLTLTRASAHFSR